MTTDAVLQRLEESDEGTFGHLVAARLVLFSGELPWRANAPSISCVPPGVYQALFTQSPRYGRALYLVTPVIRRSGIRIHPANVMGDLVKGFKSQLNGCIALGEKLGWLDKQKAVLMSVPAVRRLEEYFEGKQFQLEIRPCF